MTLVSSRKVAALAALTSVLLTACTGNAPPPGPATSAEAEPNVLAREPLPTVADDFTVLAATGDAVWASFPPTVARWGNRLSLDGGATWDAEVPHREIGFAVGYRGRFGYSGGDDGRGVPYLMDPAAPAKATRLTGKGGGRIVAMGVGGGLTSTGSLMTASAMGHIDFPRLPKTAAPASHGYAFTGDAALVLRISATSGDHDYAGVVDTATRKPLGRLELPRARAHVVAGSAIHSLVAGPDGLSLCRQPLPSGAPACQVITGGDRSGVKATLYQFGEASVIDDAASVGPLLVENGRVTPVALPAGTVEWTGEGNGDPRRPLLRTIDDKGVPHHLRVDEQGGTTEWGQAPRRTAQPVALDLTPSTALITWPDRNRPVEARALTPSGFGRAAVLDAGNLRVAATSGSRWLVLANGRYAVYDNGVRVDTFARRPLALSGPYVTTDDGVRLITGRRVSAGVASFGSLVARRAAPSEDAGRLVLTVRNLAEPRAASVTVRFGGDDAEQQILMWGEWVGATLAGDGGDQAALHNLRTGRVLARPGLLLALGDGVAVLGVPSSDPGRPPGELVVWNLTTDETTPLPGTTDGSPFGLNGDRIVYATDTDLIVRTIPGVATTQPRLLGAVAAGRATSDEPLILALDATKPLRNGTMTISDPTGRAVRTLPTPAAPAGSLHDLRWDGRDDAGAHVPAGAYTWRLQAAAADGSGQLVSVTGTGAAEGSFTVG